jgi:predicted metal-dependent hydrolase
MEMTRLAKLANVFRRQYPHLSFSVKRGKIIEGNFAYCQKVGEKYVVMIDRSIPEDWAMFLLPHELAHAIAYHEEKDHGPMFWSAYEINYETYVKFCEGKVMGGRKSV